MAQRQSASSERFLPVFIGAVGLAGITAARAALVTVTALITGHWGEVGMALFVVAVAGTGGAAGGLVYVYLGAPLRRVPKVGPYVAGVVTVAGYLGVVLLLIEYIDPGTGLSAKDAVGQWSYVVCSLLLGIACGHLWFRNGSNSGH